MCRAVRCKTCNLATWAGCGQHVDQVMAAVPRDARCPGHPRTETGGWLGRLFGRQ